VQGHLSRVRSALAAVHGEAGTVTGGPAGYQLVADVQQLDVRTVWELRRLARVDTLAGDDRAAADQLHRARALWRGEPELPATAAGEAERTRWRQEHLLLVEDHLAAMVDAGSAAGAVPELEALTALHPLRERLWGLRMEALYRCGRQADALASYRAVHRHLAEEVGVEPGPHLRALLAAILDHALPQAVAPSPSATPAAALAVDVPRYANAGGVHVAYGTYGDGATDVLLLNPTFVPVDAYLEEPHLAWALTRLAAGRRVIALDRRGLGLSDPVAGPASPTITQWVQDTVAVLDACRAAPVHVLANGDTGLVALLLAATHPDRVATLTLVNCYARLTSCTDYPFGDPPSIDETLRAIRTPGACPAVDVLSWIAPSVAGDPRFRTWWDTIGRRGASPRAAELFQHLVLAADLRDVLAGVSHPVLVLSRLNCASYDPGHGRYLVEHLPDGRLAEDACPDGPWFLGDVDWVLEQFAAFLDRARGS
jgi:pimeloyl-ACP methyl ester carboxylesterase/DNA-binding SARP family transcriptional activator